MGKVWVAVIAAALMGQVALAASDQGQSTPPPPVSLTINPPPDTPAAPAAAPVNQKEEDTPDYVEGYSDGCASSNLRYAKLEHVKPNKDSKLYDDSKEYRDGWNHGFRTCEDKVSPGAISVPANSVIQ